MGQATIEEFRPKSAVTYRCTLPSGRDVAMSLRLPAEAATLSDAWRRLVTCFGDFDPATIEIEIREEPVGFRAVRPAALALRP